MGCPGHPDAEGAGWRQGGFSISYWECSVISLLSGLFTSGSQEFLVLDAVAPEPLWMFNTDLTGGTQWLRQPARLILPCFLPLEVGRFGTAWLLTSNGQPLLQAAIREGCELTVAQLRALQEALKFPLPPRGSGSGKRGSLVRQDYASSLVAFLFDSDPAVTQEMKDEMIKGIMKGVGKRAQTVRCPEDVIMAVKELGKEAEMDFAHVHEVALNQQAMEEDKKKRKAKANEPALREDPAIRTYTPTQLKDLLPPNAWCNRQPLLQRYQGGFDTGP